MSTKVNWLTSDRYVEPIGPPDSDGVIDLDIQVDIYSDGKEDWLASTDLNRMKFPVEAIGGQSVASGTLGTTYLFKNSWTIKPYEGSHTFNLSGNAFTETGIPLVVDTYATDVNVRVNTEVTLSPPGLGLTPAQADAVEQSVFSNYVTVDVVNGSSNIEFPAGTSGQPINNIVDAQTVAASRSIDGIFVVGDLTIASTDDISGYQFKGASPASASVTFDSGCITTDVRLADLELSGWLGGQTHIAQCAISSDGLYSVGGHLHTTMIAGDMSMSTDSQMHLLDCYSGIAGTDHPTIDVSGGDQNLAIRGYEGGIGITNSTNANFKASIDLVSGQIFISSDVLAGSITCRGVGQLTNSASSDVTVNSSYLVDDTTKMAVIGKQTLAADGTLTLYKDDGVTALATQTLTNVLGQPIVVSTDVPAQRTQA